MEASARDVALHLTTAGADGSVIRGLGFAHYAANENPSNGRSGAVIANARGWEFENNTVAWSNSSGLFSVVGDPARPAIVRGKPGDHRRWGLRPVHPGPAAHRHRSLGSVARR
ncbi:MAG: hypothetical protein M3R01_09410 [Actinomycetota bacterium]|nr:hypothetical protein [Actinomycetota bacterium]